jgi:predicted nuclease of predicted toxin-antitoxin system
MTLLFDQNSSFRVTKKLKVVYPDVVHVTDVGLKDASDFEIWKYVGQHSCCIVTFDADFYNLVSLYGSPPKVIWLRTGNTTSSELIQLFETKQSAIQAFLDDSVTELLIFGE